VGGGGVYVIGWVARAIASACNRTHTHPHTHPHPHSHRTHTHIYTHIHTHIYIYTCTRIHTDPQHRLLVAEADGAGDVACGLEHVAGACWCVCVCVCVCVGRSVFVGRVCGLFIGIKGEGEKD
jgi:hypothetical protein